MQYSQPIIVAVYQLYLNQMLQIRWRRWLTDHYLDAWLADRAYYRMQLVGGSTDNPDQRIAEDLRLFVASTLALSLGLLSAVVTLGSFIAILWGLSGAVTLPVGPTGVTLPGYMVWAALVYAIAGTWLTHTIGRALIRLNFDQQRFEADFRFNLVRFRENVEGVALYAGEADEGRTFRERFAHVVGNWWGIMRTRKRLNWVASFLFQFSVPFPYIIVAPRYFAGEVTLGYIFQVASAFLNVRAALWWFIDIYPQFAAWKATVDRLTSFSASLERVKAEAGQLGGERAEASDDTIGIEALQLALPQGQPLVTGPSGAGKSTFFRALAGIWPYWKGRLRLPQGARLLFLPQKPYLPIGTLKRAVTYPADAGSFSDAEIADALRAVGLAQLANDLERAENWAQVLSGGEQQRLAFARALLNKPDWLFLDEATASLPEDAQEVLYRLLKQRLPHTTLVSIGHRASLRGYHEHQYAWQGERLAAVG